MTPTSPSSLRLQPKPDMQLHNLRHQPQPQPDPPLSPTGISNPVKQLPPSASRSKRSINPPEVSLAPDSTSQRTVSEASHRAPESAHRQPQKRQIRKRVHTARPYQDSLLNMAEARKEVAAALKLHRASRKQQEARQQQQQPTVPRLPLQHPCFQQDARIMPLTDRPIMYPSFTDNFLNFVDGSSFSYFSHPTVLVPNPLNGPAASPVAPPHMSHNLVNYNLPNLPLGFSFPNFNNLNPTLYLDNSNASFYSYSPPLSSSPSLSVSNDQEVPSVAISQGDGTSALANDVDSIAEGKQTAMGDEGMAEMRSWALWPKIMKNMEHEVAEEDAAHPVIDGTMEIPEWLNANERCFDEQCSEQYAFDPALPRMDIGDFEGMGEEWLAWVKNKV